MSFAMPRALFLCLLLPASALLAQQAATPAPAAQPAAHAHGKKAMDCPCMKKKAGTAEGMKCMQMGGGEAGLGGMDHGKKSDGMQCMQGMGEKKDAASAVHADHAMADMPGMDGQPQPADPKNAPAMDHAGMSGMDHAAMGGHDGMQMGGAMEMRKPVLPTGPLKVSYGTKSAEWTVTALAALPHKTVTVWNEHAKANQSYSGVLLMDLLTPLGAPAKLHGADLRLYVVAEGADGYKAVCALAEVNPDVRDGSTIVADALDGKPLGDSGPLQIVVTGDKRPARWVRNLAAVRVLTAE